MKEIYSMYFEEVEQSGIVHRFGACYSEKSARSMVAEYRLFMQKTEGKHLLAAYMIEPYPTEPDPSLSHLAISDTRLHKLTVAECNRILNED